MAIIVTECDPVAQQAVLIRTLARHLTPHSDQPRFDWMYLRNPAGRARTWIARAGTDGPVVGMAAAFPRDMRIGSRAQRAWVLGDFCMADEYRSLGPALQLQRACLSVVDGPEPSFCYDFPSHAMLAVYRRLGIQSTRAFVRWAKPLRIDRKVRATLGASPIGAVVSAAGNLAMRLADIRAGADPSLEMTMQSIDCDAEFSKTDEQGIGPDQIAMSRSPEYLNWRYRCHPTAGTEMMTVRQHGRVAGYLAYAQQDEDVEILDLVGYADEAVAHGLLASLVAMLRRRRVCTVSAYLTEGHPLAAVLARRGFQRREESPFVIYAGSARADFTDRLRGLIWLIMSGDRDT